MAIKTDDYRTIPMCPKCHGLQHCGQLYNDAQVLRRILDTQMTIIRNEGELPKPKGVLERCLRCKTDVSEAWMNWGMGKVCLACSKKVEL